MPEINPFLEAEKERVRQLKKFAADLKKDDPGYTGDWTINEIIDDIGQFLKLPDSRRFKAYEKMAQEAPNLYGATSEEVREKLKKLWNPVDPEKLDPKQYMSFTRDWGIEQTIFDEDEIKNSWDAWKQQYLETQQKEAPKPFDRRIELAEKLRIGDIESYDGWSDTAILGDVSSALRQPNKRKILLEWQKLNIFPGKSIDEIEDELRNTLGLPNPKKIFKEVTGTFRQLTPEQQQSLKLAKQQEQVESKKVAEQVAEATELTRQNVSAIEELGKELDVVSPAKKILDADKQIKTQWEKTPVGERGIKPSSSLLKSLHGAVLGVDGEVNQETIKPHVRQKTLADQYPVLGEDFKSIEEVEEFVKQRERSSQPLMTGKFVEQFGTYQAERPFFDGHAINEALKKTKLNAPEFRPATIQELFPTVFKDTEEGKKFTQERREKEREAYDFYKKNEVAEFKKNLKTQIAAREISKRADQVSEYINGFPDKPIFIDGKGYSKNEVLTLVDEWKQLPPESKVQTGSNVDIPRDYARMRELYEKAVGEYNSKIADVDQIKKKYKLDEAEEAIRNSLASGKIVIRDGKYAYDDSDLKSQIQDLITQGKLKFEGGQYTITDPSYSQEVSGIFNAIKSESQKRFNELNALFKPLANYQSEINQKGYTEEGLGKQRLILERTRENLQKDEEKFSNVAGKGYAALAHLGYWSPGDQDKAIQNVKIENLPLVLSSMKRELDSFKEVVKNRNNALLENRVRLDQKEEELQGQWAKLHGRPALFESVLPLGMLIPVTPEEKKIRDELEYTKLAKDFVDEALNTLQVGDTTADAILKPFAKVWNNPAKVIPFLRQLHELGNNSTVAKAVEKFRTDPESLTDGERDILTAIADLKIQEGVRPEGWNSMVEQGIDASLMMLPYVAEFMVTGPVYGAVAKGVISVGTKIAPTVIEKAFMASPRLAQVAETGLKVAEEVGSRAAGTLAQTVAATAPQMAAQVIERRTSPIEGQLVPDEIKEGELVPQLKTTISLGAVEEAPLLEDIAKVALNNIVEIGTERAGARLIRGLGWVTSKAGIPSKQMFVEAGREILSPNKFTSFSKLVGRMVKQNHALKQQLKELAQFGNFGEELSEEVLNQLIVNVNEGNPINEGLKPEDIGAISIAIGLWGGMGKVVNLGTNWFSGKILAEHQLGLNFRAAGRENFTQMEAMLDVAAEGKGLKRKEDYTDWTVIDGKFVPTKEGKPIEGVSFDGVKVEGVVDSPLLADYGVKRVNDLIVESDVEYIPDTAKILQEFQEREIKDKLLDIQNSLSTAEGLIHDAFQSAFPEDPLVQRFDREALEEKIGKLRTSQTEEQPVQETQETELERIQESRLEVLRGHEEKLKSIVGDATPEAIEEYLQKEPVTKSEKRKFEFVKSVANQLDAAEGLVRADIEKEKQIREQEERKISLAEVAEQEKRDADIQAELQRIDEEKARLSDLPPDRIKGEFARIQQEEKALKGKLSQPIEREPIDYTPLIEHYQKLARESETAEHRATYAAQAKLKADLQRHLDSANTVKLKDWKTPQEMEAELKSEGYSQRVINEMKTIIPSIQAGVQTARKLMPGISTEIWDQIYVRFGMSERGNFDGEKVNIDVEPSYWSEAFTGSPIKTLVHETAHNILETIVPEETREIIMKTLSDSKNVKSLLGKDAMEEIDRKRRQQEEAAKEREEELKKQGVSQEVINAFKKKIEMDEREFGHEVWAEFVAKALGGRAKARQLGEKLSKLTGIPDKFLGDLIYLPVKLSQIFNKKSRVAQSILNEFLIGGDVQRLKLRTEQLGTSKVELSNWKQFTDDIIRRKEAFSEFERNEAAIDDEAVKELSRYGYTGENSDRDVAKIRETVKLPRAKEILDIRHPDAIKFIPKTPTADEMAKDVKKGRVVELEYEGEVPTELKPFSKTEEGKTVVTLPKSMADHIKQKSKFVVQEIESAEEAGIGIEERGQEEIQGRREAERLRVRDAKEAGLEAEVPKEGEEDESGVRIPIMLTNHMRSELRRLGLTIEQINKLTPIEAHEILKQPFKSFIENKGYTWPISKNHPDYQRLFTEFRGLKSERVGLPSVEEIVDIMDKVVSSGGYEFIGDDGRFSTIEDALNEARFIRDVFDSLPDKVPVYRAVAAKEVHIDPYGIGESWSMELTAAQEFGGHNGSNKIIKGYVNKTDIDFISSIEAFVQFTSIDSSDAEWEIVIPAGTDIANISVEDIDTATPLPDYESGVTYKSDRLKQQDYFRQALRIIANNDKDRASIRNGLGFNKEDSNFGHSLLDFPSWSDKQAIHARKLAIKYGKQLPLDLLQKVQQPYIVSEISATEGLPVILRGSDYKPPDGSIWPDAVIGFGEKHQGHSLSYIQENDPAYLEWFIRNVLHRKIPAGLTFDSELINIEDKNETRDVTRDPDDRRPPALDSVYSGEDIRPLSEERIAEYGLQVARKHDTKTTGRQYLPESIRGVLRPHQEDAINLAFERFDAGFKGFIDADGTGAGKTLSALGAAVAYPEFFGREFDIPVLIVTHDKRVYDKSFVGDAKIIDVNVHYVTKPSEIKKGIPITTYNRLENFKNQKIGLLILDESHNLKNIGTGKTQAGLELIEDAKNVLALSATPVDKASQFFYLSRLLRVPFQSIMSELGYGQNKYKDWILRIDRTESLFRLGAMFRELTKGGFMVKREVSLKNVDISVKRIDLSVEDLQRYQTAEGEFYRRVAEAEPRRRGITKATGLMALRRLVEEHKVYPALEIALQELDEGKQVVIFADRVNDSEILGTTTSDGTLQKMEELLTEFNIPYSRLYGSNKDAAQEIERFQKGISKVMIATVASGGTGLSLDDVTGKNPRSMVILSAPFSAMGVVQAIGRINRLNTLSRSKVFMLRTNTMVDDWNSDIIMNKLHILGASVEGDYQTIPEDLIDFVTPDDAIDDIRVPSDEQRPFNIFPISDKPVKQIGQSLNRPIRRLQEYLPFIPNSIVWPNAILGFGKHAGKSLADLNRKERQYLEWLFRQVGVTLPKNLTFIKYMSDRTSLLKEQISQVQEVRDKDGNLLAPNGKKSNLTAYAWKVVRTPIFKEWFGDWENTPENASKVVDENGEPLVVYHTSKEDFDIFIEHEQGMWFSSDADATYQFVKENTGRIDVNTLPVFLKIDNPERYSTFEEFLEEGGMISDRAEMIAFLKKSGIDGVSIDRSYAEKDIPTNGVAYRYAELPDNVKFAIAPTLEYLSPNVLDKKEDGWVAFPKDISFNAPTHLLQEVATFGLTKEEALTSFLELGEDLEPLYMDQYAVFSPDQIKSIFSTFTPGQPEILKSARVVFKPKELSQEDAVKTVLENIDGRYLAGWFRNGDRSYKTLLVRDILENEGTLNAGINIFHKVYQDVTGTIVPFNEFIRTPIKLYRGGVSQEDVFSSFSVDRRVAERFGNVVELLVRPQDTLGMYQTIAEAEVLVPIFVLKSARITIEGQPVTVDNFPEFLGLEKEMMSGRDWFNLGVYGLAAIENFVAGGELDLAPLTHLLDDRFKKTGNIEYLLAPNRLLELSDKIQAVDESLLDIGKERYQSARSIVESQGYKFIALQPGEEMGLTGYLLHYEEPDGSGRVIHLETGSDEEIKERLKQKYFSVRRGEPIGFRYTTDYVARERFDLPSLKKIGSGSDRDVYDLGESVLKVAKTARGLSQNQAEGDYYLVDAGIIPEAREHGLNYVVVDKTDEIDFDTRKMLKELANLTGRDVEQHTDKAQRILGKYGLSDILNYDILWLDFIAPRNWGTKNGKPIHLDAGTFLGADLITQYRGKKNLDDQDFRDIYRKSKAAKKEFGDTDKATMYSARDIQISLEFRPGQNILPFSTPERVVRYSQAMNKILYGYEENQNQVFKILGIRETERVLGVGWWKNQTNPVLQIRVDDSSFEDAVQKVEVAISAMGLLFKQDAVAWHKPRFIRRGLERANGVDIIIGRVVTADEVKYIGERMAEKGVDYALISTPTGIRFLDYSDLTDKRKFHIIAEEIIPDNWKKVRIRYYMHDGKVIENNWKENPDGGDYRKILSWARRPDILRTVLGDLAEKVAQTNIAFARGWGSDPTLFERDLRDAREVTKQARRVVAAALYDPDTGLYGVGNNHLEAFQSLSKESPSLKPDDFDQVVDGRFVTALGEVVRRGGLIGHLAETIRLNQQRKGEDFDIPLAKKLLVEQGLQVSEAPKLESENKIIAATVEFGGKIGVGTIHVFAWDDLGIPPNDSGKHGFLLDNGRVVYSYEDAKKYPTKIDMELAREFQSKYPVMYSARDTILVDGKERPILNSNGKLIHPTEEGLRNFWRWFGDSKVVDDDGSPLVVYHGTRKGGFQVFENQETAYGFFFTDEKSAAEYYTLYGTQSELYTVYLNVKTPLRLDRIVEGEIDIPADIRKWAKGEFEDIDGFREWLQETSLYARGMGRAQNSLMRSAETLGYDGVIFYDARGGGGASLSYVVFSPDQIKSAIGNIGTFSPDPNILKSERDIVSKQLLQQEYENSRYIRPEPSESPAPEKISERDILTGEPPSYPEILNNTYSYPLREPDPAFRILATEALADIEKPFSFNWYGNAISAELREKGAISLRGQIVDNAMDMATLAQVYRDPRFETLRVFLLDEGNKILDHFGLTSRLPGSVNFDASDLIDRISFAMEGSGATKYILVHNHPVGNPMPSVADLRVTAKLRKAVPGFEYHVIINSNRYGYIDKENLSETPERYMVYGNVVFRKEGNIYEKTDIPPSEVPKLETTFVTYKDFSEEKLLKPSVPNKIIGRLIEGVEDVVSIGKEYKGTIAVGVNADGKIAAIAEIPTDRLEHSVAYFQQMSGSNSVTLINLPQEKISEARELAERDLLHNFVVGDKLYRNIPVMKSVTYPVYFSARERVDKLYSIRGELGLEGPEGELRNLVTAKIMEERGDPPKNIYFATGWERGVDGKWRYDLTSDVRYQLSDGALGILEDGGKVSLGELLLGAEDLFQIYPTLRDILVESGQGSVYSAGANRIGLNLMSSDGMLSDILHEIQHAIQEIEGFLLPRVNSREIDDLIYHHLYGDFFEKLLDRYGRVPTWGEIFANRDNAPEALRPLIDAVSDSQYWRSADEVEARNVETRLSMTPEERKKTLISETEDVARDHQIVLRKELDIPNQYFSQRVTKTKEFKDWKKTIDNGKPYDSKYIPIDIDTYFNKTDYVEDVIKAFMHGKKAEEVIEFIVPDFNDLTPAEQKNLTDLIQKQIWSAGYKNLTDMSEQFKLENKDLDQIIELESIPRVDKLYSIRGELGLEGPEGELRNLVTAKIMEERGDPPKDIYFATGWERGVDRKWRYDVLDGELTEVFKEYLNNVRIYPRGIPLNQSLKNTSLFEIYPELSDIIVKFYLDHDRTRGVYDDIENKIYLNIGEGGGNLRTLLHEVQHAIQKIEGFPLNPTPEDYDTYRRLAEEVEASNVETRLSMTPEERKKTLISETEDVPREKQILSPEQAKSFLEREVDDVEENQKQSLRQTKFFSARDFYEDAVSLLNTEESFSPRKLLMDEKTVRDVFEYKLNSERGYPAVAYSDLIAGEYRYVAKFADKVKNILTPRWALKGSLSKQQAKEFGWTVLRFDKAWTYQDYLYPLKMLEKVIAEMKPELRDSAYMALRSKTKGRLDYAVLEELSGYMYEELMPQKVSEMIEWNHKKVLEELVIGILKPYSRTEEEAVMFANLMHAPERNYQIAQVNPEFGKIFFTDEGEKIGGVIKDPDLGGSGISTKAAIFGGEVLTDDGKLPVNGLLRHFETISVLIRDVLTGDERTEIAGQGSKYEDLKLGESEIVRNIAPGATKKDAEGLVKAHEWIMGMLERNRDNAVKFGLISIEDKLAMETAYRYYFPLRDLDDIQYGSLHGELSNFREWTKRATGRHTLSGLSLNYALSLYDSTVKKGHQNMVVEKIAQLLLMSTDKNWDNLVDDSEEQDDPTRPLIPMLNIKKQVIGYKSKLHIKKTVNGRVVEEPFFYINQVTSKPVISKSGLVKRVADPTAQQDPARSIAFKKNGDTVTLTLNYQELARAVNRLASGSLREMLDPWYNQVVTQGKLEEREAESSSGLVEDLMSQFREGGTWAKLMRFYGQSYTSWSPLFIIYNAQRDASTALINIFGENMSGARMSAKALKSLGVLGPFVPLTGLFSPAANAVSRYLRGRLDMSNKYDRYLDEMNKEGGLVSFYGSESSARLLKKIEQGLKTEGTGYWSNPLKGLHKGVSVVGELIANQNSKIEVATRLAAYISARENGYTPARAASIAKNITVNFNRKGMGGSKLYDFMRQSYLFFNANVQGIARFAQASATGKIRKLIYPGLTTFAFLAAEWARISGGEDDDGRDKWDHMDDTKKEKNLLIYMGGNQYWGIKLPFGHGLAFQLGYALNDIVHYFASGGKKGKAPDVAVWNLINAAINFVDVAGTGVSFGDKTYSIDLGFSAINMLTPSILRPFIGLAINRDYNGNPIKPRFEKPGPAYLTSNGRAGYAADLIAENLNRVRFDGSRPEEKPEGVISRMFQWSPDEIRYLMDNAFGGFGKLIMEGIEASIGAAEGKPLVSDIPLYRGLLIENRDVLTRELYNRYEEFMQQELNTLVKDAGDKGLVRYSPYLNLKSWFNSRVREIDQLSKKIKEAKGDHEKRERLIEERRQLMLKVNIKMEEAERISRSRP